MIFKRFFCFFCLISALGSLGDDFITSGGTAVLRPILLRSEFVSRGTLRNLQNYSTQEGYSVFGFPKFKNIYIKRDLCFWETKLAQTKYYARYLNREYRQYFVDHPEIFSEETVEAAKLGKTINPKLKDGTPLEWHHGKDGYELVPKNEHHSKPHTGGAKTYGHKYAKAAAKLPNREIILTAQRWGKFVAIDLAFSTVGLASSGESNWQAYAVNTLASATAGAVAWGVESLLITAFPLLQGSTPVFIAGCAFNLGGPASWIASASFMIVKYGIMAAWNHHQIEVAKQIEEQCHYGEKMVRFRMLKIKSQQNSEKLYRLGAML